MVIDGDRIAYVGPRQDTPDTDAEHEIQVPVLMPGMWDCHVHFWGTHSVHVTELATLPAPLAAIRAAGDATLALSAGFTSVREVGGLGIHLARAVAEGTVRGPRVYAAGAMIGPTGGHADHHLYPADVLDRLGGVPVFRVCDGVPECLKAVREQIRAGADLIKVVASGGIGSQYDEPEDEQFSPEELGAIVAEARRCGRAVAAHCHGAASIKTALRAGVTTIEHGTCLDEEAVDMMVDADAVLVPTRLIVEDMLAAGPSGTLPEFAYRKELAYAERHAQSLQLAVARGVRIAMGTDCFSSLDGLPARWGTNARELQWLVRAGMSPLEAIETTTAHGPHTLGPRAPRSGMVAVGYDADLLALNDDPRADITRLADRPAVLAVWQAGNLVHRAAAAVSDHGAHA